MLDAWEFALVGFLAQLVDGSLGMGFGIISSALLLAQGVPPPLVSATVNAAKLPTGGTAALSNFYHKHQLEDRPARWRCSDRSAASWARWCFRG